MCYKYFDGHVCGYNVGGSTCGGCGRVSNFGSFVSAGIAIGSNNGYGKNSLGGGGHANKTKQNYYCPTKNLLHPLRLNGGCMVLISIVGGSTIGPELI